MRERKTPENKEGLLHARRPCNLGLGICAEAERRSSQLQPVTVGRRRGVWFNAFVDAATSSTLFVEMSSTVASDDQLTTFLSPYKTNGCRPRWEFVATSSTIPWGYLLYLYSDVMGHKRRTVWWQLSAVIWVPLLSTKEALAQHQTQSAKRHTSCPPFSQHSISIVRTTVYSESGRLRL